MFQQTPPYHNAFTGKLAVVASYVIVVTYFTGIMIQADYIDDDDPTVGGCLLVFALVLITFAVRMSWADVDEQVTNGRVIDSLYVELNNKQQQHKKVDGRVVHATCIYSKFLILIKLIKS